MSTQIKADLVPSTSQFSPHQQDKLRTSPKKQDVNKSRDALPTLTKDEQVMMDSIIARKEAQREAKKEKDAAATTKNDLHRAVPRRL